MKFKLLLENPFESDDVRMVDFFYYGSELTICVDLLLVLGFENVLHVGVFESFSPSERIFALFEDVDDFDHSFLYFLSCYKFVSSIETDLIVCNSLISYYIQSTLLNRF